MDIVEDGAAKLAIQWSLANFAKAGEVRHGNAQLLSSFAGAEPPLRGEERYFVLGADVGHDGLRI